MTLASLEARIAAATGPDREIDAALWWAVEKRAACGAYFTGAMGLPKPVDEMPDHFVQLGGGLGRKSVIVMSPRLTESIDAIVALITRRCPPGRDDAREPKREQFGWTINMAQRLDWTWEAYLYRVSDGIKGFAICPTPALALCLALVRAEMAKEEAK